MKRVVATAHLILSIALLIAIIPEFLFAIKYLPQVVPRPAVLDLEIICP